MSGLREPAAANLVYKHCLVFNDRCEVSAGASTSVTSQDLTILDFAYFRALVFEVSAFRTATMGDPQARGHEFI